MFGAINCFSDFEKFLSPNTPKFSEKFLKISTFSVANHFSAHSMMFWANKFVADFENFLSPTPPILNQFLKNSTFWVATWFCHNDLPFLTSKNIQLTIAQFGLHPTITHDCLSRTIDIIWSKWPPTERNNNFIMTSDDMRPPLSVHAQRWVYISAEGTQSSEVRRVWQ